MKCVRRDVQRGQATATVLGLIALGIGVAILVGYNGWTNRVEQEARNTVQRAELLVRQNPALKGQLELPLNTLKLQLMAPSKNFRKMSAATEQLLERMGAAPATSTRTSIKTYDRDHFFYHLRTCWSASDNAWSVHLPPAGTWTLSTHRPDQNGAVPVWWGYRTTCQVDAAHGPFRDSSQLCPKAAELKLKMTKDDTTQYGCG